MGVLIRVSFTVAFVFSLAVRVTSRVIHAASSYSLLPYISFDNRCTSYVHRRPFTNNTQKGLYEAMPCKRISLSILLGIDHRELSKAGGEKEI